ncbi:MAG TPA: hypothetical protein ENI13_00070 [candidate division CPR3 bacterium]|uniref:Uncharacterized protein n=1 Tax=candidate division CPR3 bacterium TaxID=2268181 RepID=A0A7C1SMN7_UNCC3|nr:hypothetical protein [candidate division CPR3 bacterium]
MKLLLPRGYLSWTGYNLWLHNKEKYRKIYYLGEKSFSNREMKYGKRLADHLEKNTDEEDEIIKALGSLLPQYPKNGYEMNAVLKSGKQEIPLKSFFDTYKPSNHSLREYKTGRGIWTQGKADRHGQILFYCLVIYLATGEMPKEIHLDWIETKIEDEEVVATGMIFTFKVEKKLSDVLSMAGRVTKVAKEISEDYSEAFKKTL